MRSPHNGRYILNAAGEPVPCEDLITWGRFMEDGIKNRRVSEDRDEGPDGQAIWISTVFLGLDHAFDAGPPVLWETMVFGGPLDGEQDRYTSLADALHGHQDMCRRVRVAVTNPGAGA